MGMYSAIDSKEEIVDAIRKLSSRYPDFPVVQKDDLYEELGRPYYFNEHLDHLVIDGVVKREIGGVTPDRIHLSLVESN